MPSAARDGRTIRTDHAGQLTDLHCGFVQCDEIWTYVGKKDKRVRKEDSPHMGSQWVFVAMDEDTELVPHYQIGRDLALNLSDWMRKRRNGRQTNHCDDYGYL
jgi:hypothetical protein